MFKPVKKNLLLLLRVVTLLAVPQAASATVLTFGLDIEFSGATPPAGTAPWITATFDDGGTAGTVDLTLSSAGLGGAEFIDEWLFNLNPVQNGLLPLTIVQNMGPTAAITQGTDAFKADGDGFYDIKFDFAAGAPQRLGSTSFLQQPSLSAMVVQIFLQYHLLTFSIPAVPKEISSPRPTCKGLARVAMTVAGSVLLVRPSLSHPRF